MRRRNFLEAVGAGGALWFSGCGGRSRLAGTERKKPNFVFFLVDDLGWKDLGCYGSTFYETPNIDRLAARGHAVHERLRRLPGLLAHAGQHHDRQVSGPAGDDRLHRRAAARHRAEALDARQAPAARPLRRSAAAGGSDARRGAQGAGYATFFAGKWHLGPEGFWPEDQGFDVNIGGIDRGGPYGGKQVLLALRQPAAARRPGRRAPARPAGDRDVPSSSRPTRTGRSWPTWRSTPSTCR